MKPLARQEIVVATGGRVAQGLLGKPLTAVFTDTRVPQRDGLFVALAGERFDAHDFLADAIAARCGGVVVSREDAVPADCPDHVLVVVVDDTREALKALARHVRARMTAKVVAVTGSVGKTTVKDMTADALMAFGSVGRTIGNFNNEVGLPLSLFGLAGDEDYVVLELGMSAAGEIARLAEIARPDVGIVTAAAAAHLEFFASVDAIADAKAELFASLGERCRGVANADDARVLKRGRDLCGDRLITYGFGQEADVQIEDLSETPEGLYALLETPVGGVEVQLRAHGRHMAANAAAALAAVIALGMDPRRATLSLARRFEPGKHRMQRVSGRDGLMVLDDCYNANPASTKAALATFGSLAEGAARRGAVLGSMLELGPTAPELHRDVGAMAAAAGVDVLWALGPHADDLAAGAREAGLAEVHTAADAADVADAVAAFAAPDRWLLLKGSRGGRLERLLDVLAPSDAEGGA